ncbi:hypothetical protein KP509_02G004400 [Ceratopteris richardii]|uniref:Timeless N-terminal domain-containing protein n=2 Tax=Ceratopteris richardii TaxID=49495 RepID=A0A8T2VB18_CERRI|nr:hypothetical protein KP509_02G004400 [Ceratopteris richardii]
MATAMEVEGLDAVCAGLGFPSQDPSSSYIKSEHCLENLKNLQRFLRRDHPTSRPVFKQLGKWNTVGRDLVPIISQYRDDPELIINAVKVVVFLTMPVDALSENVSEQLDYVLDFKESFLRNDAIAVIMTLLEEPLEHLESDTFSEEDWKVVQLVLTLMRNLLEVQDLSFQKVAVNESMRVLSTRDKLLEHLFEENVMDLLLALAQYISGSKGPVRQDCTLFLEIFHHIFWGQSPEKIVRESDQKALDKKSKQPGGLLQELTKVEKEQLKDIRLKELSRHSRFSGSFVQVAQDGSKRMLKRNPFQSSITSVLRGPQIKHGPVKRVAFDRSSLPSDGRVLELLKTFADQILLGSYNLVMQCIKEDISRERSWIQTSDVALFFEVAKFFTAYQRCLISNKSHTVRETIASLDEDKDCLFQGLLCGPIASTMDQDMFTMVVLQWHKFADLAKETNDWDSLSTTSSLFKEMIRMLDVVLKGAKDSDKSEQQEVRVARILLYKIFYDQTEKGTFQFLLHLLKSFDIHKQPRSHLSDLVETVHVVLRIIEFLTKEEGALRVLKKRRKGRKKIESKRTDKPRSNDATQVEADAAQSGEQVMEQSNPTAEHHTSVQGFTVIENENPSDELNQDEYLENPISDTLLGAVGETATSELQTSSQNFETLENEDPNAEHNLSEEVGMTSKEKESDSLLHESHMSEDTHLVTERLLEESEDSEDDGGTYNVDVSLDVKRCARMFADNTVVRNYCWLLRFFMTNSAAVNHYIICMLQRICKDHSLEPMLYQLSLFEIFYEILSNKKASKLEQHVHIFSFLTKLIRNFFKKLKVQPLLFLDVLFWKNRQDCHHITLGYDIYSFRKFNGQSTKGSRKPSIADALGNDEADEEMQANLSENGFPSHQLADESGAVEEQGKPKMKKKRGKITEEQESHLIMLFEQHKNDPDCCQLLAKEIDPEGEVTAAHVRRKLKSLDLVPVLKRNRINERAESRDNTSGIGQGQQKKRRIRLKKQTQSMTDINAQLSDDEPVAQLMELKEPGEEHDKFTETKGHRRKRIKQKKQTPLETDVNIECSDDEPLSQLVKRRIIQTSEVLGNSTEQEKKQKKKRRVKQKKKAHLEADKNVDSSDNEPLTQLMELQVPQQERNARTPKGGLEGQQKKRKIKEKKEAQLETDLNLDSSDNEPLTQLMKKLHGSQGDSNDNKRELKEPAENLDETLMDHIVARRKQFRATVTTDADVGLSSPRIEESESQELMEKHFETSSISTDAIELKEKRQATIDLAREGADAFSEDNVGKAQSDSSSLSLSSPSPAPPNRRPSTFEDVDPSLEDDVELNTDNTLTSSVAAAVAGVRRRRALFVVDDDDQDE